MRLDRLDILVSLGLLLLTAAIYAPTVQFEFLAFDDDRYVTQNPLAQEGLRPDSIRRAFTEFHASNWHPLTWISHMIDVELFGNAPGAHHAVSAGLHAVATCLLFLFLRRMVQPLGRAPQPGDPRTIALPATVAALFAVHPTHVESVAWIAERKDVLCALFWILTLGAYLRYARTPSIGTYSWVLLAFVAALLSKPMAVTLPLVLLGLDIWPLGRWRRGSTRPSWLVVEKLPLFGLAFAAGILTILAQSSGGAVQPFERFPFGERVANAVVSYDRYLLLAFWPNGLSVSYPRLPPESLTATRTALAAIPLVALTAFAAWQYKQRPFLLVGWGWFLITLLPVIGLFQVGEQSIADRYTYLPYIGLSIAVVWGVESFWPRHPRRGPVLSALALCAVVGAALVASSQVAHWRDTESLWTRAIEANDGHVEAYIQLSQAFFVRGERERARYQATLAVEVAPDSPFAHYQLGMVLASLQRHEQARPHLERVLQIDPSMTPALLTLAEIDRREANYQAALAGFERALQLDPRLLEMPTIEQALSLTLRSQYEAARDAGRDLSAPRADYRRIQRRYPEWEDVAQAFRTLETANPAPGAAPHDTTRTRNGSR